MVLGSAGFAEKLDAQSILRKLREKVRGQGLFDWARCVLVASLRGGKGRVQKKKEKERGTRKQCPKK
jgi:predicted RNA binding protein with dsRBD fold (UPF0201 family)